jgi:hypothetical protein
MPDFRSPFDDPNVKSALRCRRPAADIHLIQCPGCGNLVYYNDGSHFTCSVEGCNGSYDSEGIDRLLEAGEVISLDDWSAAAAEAEASFGAELDPELAALREENARLKQWISDCQAGMYINCVYCGHRYGPDPGTPVAMADILKAHIAECPAHPMSDLLKISTCCYWAFCQLLEKEEGLAGKQLYALRRKVSAVIESASGKVPEKLLSEMPPIESLFE